MSAAVISPLGSADIGRGGGGDSGGGGVVFGVKPAALSWAAAISCRRRDEMATMTWAYSCRRRRLKPAK